MADETKNPSTQLKIVSNEVEEKVSESYKELPAVESKQPVTMIEELEEPIIITDCKLTKITLMAADGVAFEVEVAVANEMNIVKEFILERGYESEIVIPLPNVEGPALSKVIEYVSKQLEFRAKFEKLDGMDKKAVANEIKEFEAGFVKQVDNDSLKFLILAADYLDTNQLLDLLKQTAADRIKNKSVAYVRKFFGVESDYTAEEESKLRDENRWAFEGVEEDDA